MVKEDYVIWYNISDRFEKDVALIQLIEKTKKNNLTLKVHKKNKNDLAIIGLTGNKHHGKNLFSTLIRNNSVGWSEIAFADALKDITYILFELDYEQLYGNKKEEFIDKLGTTPRHLLQQIGTDIFRNLFSKIYKRSDTIWIDIIDRVIHDSLFYNWIVTDVRFQNEVDFINNLNCGMIIKIFRPDYNETSTHVSEEIDNLKNIHFKIMNNGTIDDLNEISKEFAMFFINPIYITKILKNNKVLINK